MANHDRTSTELEMEIMELKSKLEHRKQKLKRQDSVSRADKVRNYSMSVNSEMDTKIAGHIIEFQQKFFDEHTVKPLLYYY